MSLRRSARISQSAVPSPAASPASAPPKKAAALPNSNDSETKAKTKTKGATATNNKRKSRPSAETATEVQEADAQQEQDATPAYPTTPKPKRPKHLASSIPETPTPSAIALLTASSPSQPHEELAEDPDAKPRPAAPHATNAPLKTPRGSRVVAYASSPLKPAPAEDVVAAAEPVTQESPSKKKKEVTVVPPDVGVLRPPTSTVETLLEDACAHLIKTDPKLKTLIEKHHCKMFSPEGLREVVDPFTSLASSIMGQQVSGQAAASIRRKFTALFPDTHPSFPCPAQVIEKDIVTLRTAGLSQRKAEYIHGLAEKFASGELSAQMLINSSDEELIEKLVAVRGLGRWSVEMFACFGLKRMDVFSTGDLGVQRGIATYLGKNVSKLKGKGGKWKFCTEAEMLDIASRFSPYRSLFMWYMWRIENVDISILQSD